MIRAVTVNLVTPAMIGGSNSRECDKPPTLRPPAVRGMLRFWTRALGGNDPRSLETALWGSTKTGQGISVIDAPSLPGRCETRALFPRKPGRLRSEVPMVLPSDKTIRLRFRLPKPDLLPQLQAVVWTWLHLGTIGRRARRGYGSLLWKPEPGDLLAGFLGEEGFDPVTDLADSTALANYLMRGLGKVSRTPGLTIWTAGPTPVRRTSTAWFRLSSIDQVFVGQVLGATYDGQENGMEDLIHGMDVESRNSSSTRQQEQMGKAFGGRLASPMMWRLFPVQSDITKGYIPVMTWSPWQKQTQVTKPSGMYDYLHNRLGFDQSLAKCGLDA